MMTRALGIMLWAMWVAAVHAQWNIPIPLTADDSFTYTTGQRFVVDDSLRVHVFAIRNVQPYMPQPRCVAYLRLDNRGNALASPVMLAPDSQFSDDVPAVLLDRYGQIHVIWSRCYVQPHDYDTLMYARIAPDGEIVDGPRNLDVGAAAIRADHNPNMIQSADGSIWYTDSYRVVVLDEQGRLVQPARWIASYPGEWGEGALLAGAPDGSVWAAYVHYPIAGSQNIRLRRADLPGAVPEVVVGGGAIGYNVFLESFLIDSSGSFHYEIWGTTVGALYLRDPRDGSPRDTVYLAPPDDSPGQTNAVIAGHDTLTMIHDTGWSLVRFILNMDGGMMGEPDTFEVHPRESFYLLGRSPYCWRSGGHWVLGWYTLRTSRVTYQLAMIHVPGPNEPPNAMEIEARLIPDSPQLSVFPNPLNPSGVILMDLARRGVVNVEVFDVLGRRCASVANGVFEAGRHELNFDARELPTGIYFVQMQTAEQMVTRKAVVIK